APTAAGAAIQLLASPARSPASGATSPDATAPATSVDSWDTGAAAAAAPTPGMSVPGMADGWELELPAPSGNPARPPPGSAAELHCPLDAADAEPVPTATAPGAPRQASASPIRLPATGIGP